MMTWEEQRGREKKMESYEKMGKTESRLTALVGLEG